MRIVLTGGPSAGKTTIAESLVRAYWDRLVLAPEGASILFRGGFPRESTTEAVICQQRAIYHVQKELEEVKALEQGPRSMICDRGTLDGLAYWPGTEEDFFVQVNSSMAREIARYDWVIHMQTAAEEAYQPSLLRKESFTEAKLIDARIKQAWREHPRRLILSNNRSFSLKITTALLTVKMILDGEEELKIKKFASK